MVHVSIPLHAPQISPPDTARPVHQLVAPNCYSTVHMTSRERLNTIAKRMFDPNVRGRILGLFLIMCRYAQAERARKINQRKYPRLAAYDTKVPEVGGYKETKHVCHLLACLLLLCERLIPRRLFSLLIPQTAGRIRMTRQHSFHESLVPRILSWAYHMFVTWARMHLVCSQVLVFVRRIKDGRQGVPRQKIDAAEASSFTESRRYEAMHVSQCRLKDMASLCWLRSTVYLVPTSCAASEWSDFITYTGSTPRDSFEAPSQQQS
jgi:hypothetical protein